MVNPPQRIIANQSNDNNSKDDELEANICPKNQNDQIPHTELPSNYILSQVQSSL
jgi:hypothetical protein